MSLVRLRGVTRTVTLPDGEDLHILRGVNLDVAAGEHVSIVGRSGTGKSTMLNIIGLLDAPTSGTYELDGVDTTRLGEGRRARMRGEDFGFVFQQFNIFAARTAAENVGILFVFQPCAAAEFDGFDKFLVDITQHGFPNLGLRRGFRCERVTHAFVAAGGFQTAFAVFIQFIFITGQIFDQCRTVCRAFLTVAQAVDFQSQVFTNTQFFP